MFFRRTCMLLAFLLSAPLYAANNIHHHPKFKATHTPSIIQSQDTGGCRIAIYNNSNETVYVSGTFEDNAPLSEFAAPANYEPQYIDLYYPDFDGVYRCHNGLYVHIRTYDNYVIFSRYRGVDEPPIIIDPSYLKKFRV